MFKKKDENVKIDTSIIEELKTRISKLENKLDEKENKLLDEIEKLRRIVKYSSDRPEYMIKHEWLFHNYASLKCVLKLYMYIEKEEYVITLDDMEVKESFTYKFDTHNNLAYFCVYNNAIKIREYIIDYKKGTYVCSM